MKAFPSGLFAASALIIALGTIEHSVAQTETTSDRTAPSSGDARGAGPQVLIIERAKQQAELAKHEAELAKHMAAVDAQMAEQAAQLATQQVKFRTARFFANRENHELDAKIHQAAEHVRDAKDDAAKSAAMQQLTGLLDKYFEEDMAGRNEELKDIQTRLEKLQTQLDRRREKKLEIIDLQLRVALNEADGLGFYSQPKDAKWFGFDMSAPVRVSAPIRMPLEPIPDVFDAPVPTSSDAVPASQLKLQTGAKGPLVILLQRALNSHIKPNPDIAVDGDFGPETAGTVRKFQGQNDLKETGVVDAETWKALGLPETVVVKPTSAPTPPTAPSTEPAAP